MAAQTTMRNATACSGSICLFPAKQSLQKALEKHDTEALISVFESAKAEGNPREKPKGLLVDIAETAVQLGEYSVANEALRMYTSTSPPRDQFWCRSLLASSSLVCHNGRHSKGQTLVHTVQKAIGLILEAIHTASDSPQRKKEYSHIIHNASVLYMQITRCLRRKGNMSCLLKSNLLVTHALEKLDPSKTDPEWMINVYTQTAYCCHDEGDPKAKEFMDKAIELQKTYFPGNISLQKKLLRHRVYSDLKSSEALLSKPENKKPAVIAAIHLQRLYSMASTGDMSRIKDGLGRSTSALIKACSEDPIHDPEKLFVLAQIAHFCLEYGHYDTARECVTHAMKVNELGNLYHAGVMAMIVNQQLLTIHPPERINRILEQCASRGEQLDVLTRHRVGCILELVTCMQSAERLKDPELVEIACFGVWNTVLPLLGTDVDRIEMILNTCSKALEKIESGYHKLRILFHLELSKIFLASDLVKNAQNEISKALGIDYTLATSLLPASIKSLHTPEQIEAFISGEEDLKIFEYSRPLEFPCRQISLRLSIKLSPPNPIPPPLLQLAIVQIEKIKDFKKAGPLNSKRGLMEDLLKTLGKCEKEGKDVELGAKMSSDVKVLGDRDMLLGHLWFETADLAFHFGFHDLTRQASLHVVRLSWDPTRPSHKHLLVDQARCGVLLAGCCAEAMATIGVTPGLVADDSKYPLLDMYAEGLPSNFQFILNKDDEKWDPGRALEAVALTALLMSQKIGKLLKEDTIIFNALVEIWNLHAKALQTYCNSLANDEEDRANDPCYSLFLTLEKAQKALWPTSDRKWSPRIDNDTSELIISSSTVTSSYFYHISDPKRAVDLAQGTFSALTSGKKSPQKSLNSARKLLQLLARASLGSEPNPMPAKASAKCIVWLEMARMSDKIEESKRLVYLQKAFNTLDDQKGNAAKIKEVAQKFHLNDCEIHLPDLKGTRDVEAELQSVLWSQVCVEAQNLNQSKLVLIANQKATQLANQIIVREELTSGASMVDNSQKFSEAQWKWMSQSLLAAGQNLLGKIDTRTDRQRQDHIRSLALDKFVQAMVYSALRVINILEEPRQRNPLRFSLHAQRQLISSAQKIWNTALPFMRNRITRQLILEPFLILHHQLCNVINSIAKHNPNNYRSALLPKFRVSCVDLLLRCLYDQEEYQMGLDTSFTALGQIPQILAHPVWKYRVLFLLKLGKDIEKDIGNIDEGEGDITRTALYSLMAKASSQRNQQFVFYRKALQAVADTPAKIESIELIIEYAEWIFSNNLGRQVTQDFLLTAADIIIGQDSPALYNNNNGSRSGTSDSSSHGPRSCTPLIVPSLAGIRGSRVEGKQVRGTFLEKIFQNVRGLGVRELNVGHLTLLVRIYCMLAMISSNKQHTIQLILVAYHYVKQIWTLSIQTLNKEYEKKKEAVQTDTPPSGKSKKSRSPRRFGQTPRKSPKNIPDLLSSLRREPPKFAIPNSVEDWLEWRCTESLEKAFVDATQPMSIPTPKSMVSPEILLHYLQWLFKSLHETGYPFQTLAVVELMGFIARRITMNHEIVTLAKLWRAKTFDVLHLPEKAAQCLREAQPIVPNGERLANHNRRIEQRRALNELILRQPKLRCLQKSSLQGQNHLRRNKLILRKAEAQHVWLEITQELILRGRIDDATKMLELVKVHSEVFEDRWNLIRHRQTCAVIHMMNGQHEAAISLVQQVQLMEGSSDWWLQVILMLASTYLGLGTPITPSQFSVDITTAIKGHQTPEIAKSTLPAYRSLEQQAILVLTKGSSLLEELSQGEARDTVGADYLQKASILQRIGAEVLSLPRPFVRDEVSLLANSKRLILIKNSMISAFTLAYTSVCTAEALCDTPNLILCLSTLASTLERAHNSPVDIPPIHNILPSDVKKQSSRLGEILRKIPAEADTVHLQIARAILWHTSSLASEHMHSVGTSFIPVRMSFPISRLVQDLKMNLINVSARLCREEQWIRDQHRSDLPDRRHDDMEVLLKKHAKCFSSGVQQPKKLTEGYRLMHVASEVSNLYNLDLDHRRKARMLACHGTGYRQIVSDISEEFNSEAKVDDKICTWLRPWDLCCGVIQRENDKAKQDEKLGVLTGDCNGNDTVATPRTEIEKHARRDLLARRATALKQTISLSTDGIQILNRSLNAAIAADDIMTIIQSSSEAIDLVGGWNPYLTAGYLHLYQSAKLRKHAIALLVNALPANNPERLVYDKKFTVVNAGEEHICNELLSSMDKYLDRKSPSHSRTRVSLSDCPKVEISEDLLKAIKGSGRFCPEPSLPTDGYNHTAEWEKLASYLCSKREDTVFVSIGYIEEHHALYGSLLSAEQGTKVSKMVISEAQKAEWLALRKEITAWRTALIQQLILYDNANCPHLEAIDVSLGGLLSACESFVTPLMSGLGLGGPDSVQGDESILMNKKVVFTVDRTVFDFYWEGMSFFANAVSMSRVFSLSLYMRQDFAAKRIMEKKMNKTMGYIVDPADPTESKQLYTTFKRVASKLKCKGFSPDSHSPSSGEWQNILKSNPTFLFSGFGSMMNRVQWRTIAPLNLIATNVALVNDKIVSESTQRREANAENSKSDIELEIDRLYNAALLLSVRGVNTLVINQHGLSQESAIRVQSHLLLGLTSGEDCGGCVARWRADIERKSTSRSKIKSSETKGSNRLYDRLNPIVFGVGESKIYSS